MPLIFIVGLFFQIVFYQTKDTVYTDTCCAWISTIDTLAVKVPIMVKPAPVVLDSAIPIGVSIYLGVGGVMVLFFLFLMGREVCDWYKSRPTKLDRLVQYQHTLDNLSLKLDNTIQELDDWQYRNL